MTKRRVLCCAPLCGIGAGLLLIMIALLESRGSLFSREYRQKGEFAIEAAIVISCIVSLFAYASLRSRLPK